MSDDSHQWPMTHAERRALIQDDNETITLCGDDTAVSSVVVPRVWQLPPRPARGISVRDRDGKVWKLQDGPEWVDLWISGGMKALRWHELLGRRGPLTEVM